MDALNTDASAESIEHLRGAAGAGDIDAMTALGDRLLGGRGVPMSPFDGASMLVDAANKGGGAAAARVAALCAAGAATPQSWPLAFDYLQLAAERGYAPARGQLQVLAAHAGAGDLVTSATNGSANDPHIWKRLREPVDAEQWLAPPPLQVINASPRIATCEGFASPALCNWLIELGRPLLKAATVYDLDNPGLRRDGSRTNTAAEFSIVEADVIMLLVRERIAAAIKMPSRLLENTQVLHYNPGEEFRRHFDWLDPSLPVHIRELAVHGQRVLTFLIYLNEEFEGGETEFPILKMRYRGRRGDALCFRNVELSGEPDRKTMHAGLATTRGEKWLLSQWIRSGALKSATGNTGPVAET